MSGLKQHKIWQFYTRHPGSQQNRHSRVYVRADFPHNGYSAASAFLECGNTWKPPSAMKRSMLCLMYQKSYSRTHPYIKITPKRLCQLSFAASQVSVCCALHTWLHPALLGTNPVIPSEGFQFIPSFAHSFVSLGSQISHPVQN